MSWTHEMTCKCDGLVGFSHDDNGNNIQILVRDCFERCTLTGAELVENAGEYLVSLSEKNHERRMADMYGASTPQTLAERAEVDRRTSWRER